MIQTLVFDFGNVVAFFDHGLASKRLAACSELPQDVLHAQLFGTPLEDDYEAGRLSTGQFVRLACTTCRLRCTANDFASAYVDIFWPNADVCALLPRLKPYHRLLLLSNTNDLHARRFRRQFAETLALFDGLVLSHEVGQRKPDAAIYEHTLRLAGCDPAACVFIDDRHENVAAARTCGWHGIVYTDFAELCRELSALGIRV